MTTALEATLEANPSGFVKGMREAESSLEKFVIAAEGVGRGIQVAGNAFDTFAQRVQRIGKVMIGVGAGMGVGLGLAIRSAAGFQAEMLNVQSILQGSRGELMSMRDEVRRLSTQLPQDATTLAAGLYDIASSGFAGAQGLQVLNAAAVSASAGLTNTATAARAITAVLNAYGKEAGAATDVSDILFQTVNLGVITFEELAGTVGEWVSIAAAAGVAADEASAAIAAMTLSGINSAEAATALSRLIESFVNPSEELSKVAAMLGHESALAMLNTMGLTGAMEALREATGGAATAYTALFPNIRAAKGALALAANDGKNFVEVSKEITDETGRAGAAQEAFNTQMKGLGAQFQILQNNIAAYNQTIGEVFLGTLTNVLKLMNFFADMMNALPGPIKSLIGWVTALGAIMLVLSGAVLAFAAHAVIWRVAMTLMATQFAKAGAAATGFSTTLLTLKSGLLFGFLGGRAGVITKSIAGIGTGFTLLSTGATKAGKSLGPLGASLKAIRGGFTSLRAVTGPLMSGMVGFGGAAIAAGIALWTLKNMSDAAADAGRSAAEAFSSGFETDSLADLERKYDALIDKRNEVGSSFNLFTDPFSKGSEAEKNQLAIEAQNTQEAIDRMRDSAALAILEVDNLADSGDVLARGFLGKSDPDFGSAAHQFIGAEILLAEAEAMEHLYDDTLSVTELLEAARARGVDLSVFSNLDADEFAFEQTREELRALYEDLEASDPATERAQSAFRELANEFSTVTEKIEALDNVLNTLIKNELGLEEATDVVQGSINELFQDVQEMSEAGTLQEAMDFRSFHEDALTLRGSMRGLVDDITAQTIAWANQQDNLSGGDIARYLENQAMGFKSVAEELGLGQDFVDHYVDTILQIAENPELVTSFNNNIPEEIENVEGYLATLGLADQQITTALRIEDEWGRDAMIEYIGMLDTIDELDPEVLLSVEGMENLDAINKFMIDAGIDDGMLPIVIEAVAEGQSFEQVKSRLGLTKFEEENWEALVEIVGSLEAEEALAIVEASLDGLEESPYTPIVDLDIASFELKFLTVKEKLDILRTEYMNLGIDPVPPRRPSRETTNADGGHYPQIFRGHTRIFNEPETGGEAYIPLSPTKRGSAMSVLYQVMELFGMARFATGGINRPIAGGNIGGRFRPDDGGGGSGGGSGGGGGGGGDEMTALELLTAKHTLGEIDDTAYRSGLMEALAATEKYSSEYMSIWRELEGVNESIADGWDTLWQRMVQTGELSKEAYLQNLQGRLKATRKYTDEWWELWTGIQDLQEEMARDEMSRNAIMFDVGDLGEDAYLKFLNKRLKGTEKYSQEWHSIWQEIESVEDAREQREDEALEEEQRKEDLKHEIGKTSNKEYLKILRDRLASLERFSEEWADVWREIQRVEEEMADDRSSNRLGDLAGAGFVSQNQLVSYYQKKAKDYVEWYNIVKDLSESGVPGMLIQDLLSAGPQSLPLARAVQQLHASGRLGELTGALQAIEKVNTSIEGKIGASNPTFEAIGYTPPKVEISGDLYFTGPNSVKEFVAELEFQLGAN